RSGTFDEHNTFLKLGRLKLELTPNPFAQGDGFRQELVLEDGYIKIEQNGVQVKFWVDVFHPVIHLEVESEDKIQTKLSYENWRYKDKEIKGRANNANSYKWAPQGKIISYADTIKFQKNGILFFHRNRQYTVFDVAMKQQGLEAYKDSLMNPLEKLTFGGFIYGDNVSHQGTYTGVYRDADFKGYTLASIKPAKAHKINVQLYTSQSEELQQWKTQLTNAVKDYKVSSKKAKKKSVEWWNEFWDRSFIYTKKRGSTHKDTVYQLGQNYQLFRYMLGTN